MRIVAKPFPVAAALAYGAGAGLLIARFVPWDVLLLLASGMAVLGAILWFVAPSTPADAT